VIQHNLGSTKVCCYHLFPMACNPIETLKIGYVKPWWNDCGAMFKGVRNKRYNDPIPLVPAMVLIPSCGNNSKISINLYRNYIPRRKVMKAQQLFLGNGAWTCCMYNNNLKSTSFWKYDCYIFPLRRIPCGKIPSTLRENNGNEHVPMARNEGTKSWPCFKTTSMG
jgi:hypothetical protein